MVWKLVVLLALAVPVSLSAQSAKPVSLTGTWQAKMNEDTYTVVIRADSSASYGDEVVRWRARGDSIFIALGGEWVAYGVECELQLPRWVSDADLTGRKCQAIGSQRGRPSGIGSDHEHRRRPIGGLRHRPQE